MSNYYKLSFQLDPYTQDAADLLAAFLAEIGYDSFEIHSGGLDAFIIEKDYDKSMVDEIIENFCMPVVFKWDLELIPHKDWNEEWEQKYFKPLVLGDGKLVIHSTFHSDFPNAQYEIIIDPKMAFGTGHHSTTSMMVNHLMEMDLKDKTLIDMGTGTGILAILAKKLGASKVIGIEIDPFACENAEENAKLNNVNITLITGDASSLQKVAKADLFLANINRNIILADLENYVDSLNNNGELVLSGFYKRDMPLLEHGLALNGMKIVSVKEGYDDWCSIRAIKNF